MASHTDGLGNSNVTNDIDVGTLDSEIFAEEDSADSRKAFTSRLVFRKSLEDQYILGLGEIKDSSLGNLGILNESHMYSIFLLTELDDGIVIDGELVES